VCFFAGSSRRFVALTSFRYALTNMKNSQQTFSPPVWDLAELLVRVDNDQELLCELLAIFKEDFPKTMQSLQAAVARGDCGNTASLSHALKGMLSNLAAGPASAAVAEIERLAKAESRAQLNTALHAFEQQAASLVPRIEAYMAEVRR
jgi:HPt (histidine-containing phosphotransfer) domain-containing protein